MPAINAKLPHQKNSVSLFRPLLASLADQARAAAHLKHELAQHWATQQIYHHGLNQRFCYTDGVRHFFRNAGQGAYWLGDILALEPAIARGISKHQKLFAVLNVDCGAATLTVAAARDERGAFMQTVYNRKISYTDCPPGEWVFNLGLGVVGERRVVIACLPSED